jgi:hypothetical protein
VLPSLGLACQPACKPACGPHIGNNT